MPLYAGDNAQENAGCYWVTSEDAGGEFFNAYGTNNVIIMRSKIKDGNTTLEIGICFSNGVPSVGDALDNMPHGSICINKAGGDGTTFYFKEVAAGATESWSLATLGDPA